MTFLLDYKNGINFKTSRGGKYMGSVGKFHWDNR